MNPHQRHNLKADAPTQRLLKLIAAHTGEKQYAVLARLLQQEWARVQREHDTPHEHAMRRDVHQCSPRKDHYS